MIRLLAYQAECQLSENAHLALLLAYSHRQLPAERKKCMILQSKVQESASWQGTHTSSATATRPTWSPAHITALIAVSNAAAKILEEASSAFTGPPSSATA